MPKFIIRKNKFFFPSIILNIYFKVVIKIILNKLKKMLESDLSPSKQARESQKLIIV